MHIEKALNDIIEKYSISDEDVAMLEEALERDGLLIAEAPAEAIAEAPAEAIAEAPAEAIAED